MRMSGIQAYNANVNFTARRLPTPKGGGKMDRFTLDALVAQAQAAKKAAESAGKVEPKSGFRAEG